MSHRQRSVFMLLTTMLIWGSTFVVTKGLIAEFPPIALAFVRVAIGVIVLLPFALIRYRRAATAPGTSPRLPWATMSAMGFIGVALYYALFNWAMTYTSASQGALVQSCIPAGSALIGNLLMFATVICWGAYTSLAKRLADCDAMVITAGVTGIGALLLLPVAVFELLDHGWPQLRPAAWLGVFYLGAMASGAAYLLYNAALRYMDAGQAGVYTNLIPIVGVLTGALLLDESLSARAILGGAIVLAGVWITSMQRELPAVSHSPKAG